MSGLERRPGPDRRAPTESERRAALTTLARSTEAMKANHDNLDRRLSGRPSSPALPAALPDAADQLEAHVREHVAGMQEMLRVKAARRLLAIALELGVTLGPQAGGALR